MLAVQPGKKSGVKRIAGADRIDDLHRASRYLDMPSAVESDGPQGASRDDNKRGTLFLPGPRDLADIGGLAIEMMDIFLAGLNEARRSEEFKELLIIVSQAANDSGPDIGIDTDEPPSLLAIGESQVSRGYRLYRQRIGTEGKRANLGRKLGFQIRCGQGAVRGALPMERIACLAGLVGRNYADRGQARRAKGVFQV